MSKNLTHIDKSGRARMVDVSDKNDTRRTAITQGKIYMRRETLEKIRASEIAKGDVLATARIAGINGAKKTSELIPLCHIILITGVEVDFSDFMENDRAGIIITAKVTSTGKTGVEMEALTAVSVAALTIYDMCKAIDRGMTISEIRLLEKRGGKSGTWKAQ
ncbi:cyclic pyranopterin monophosphate synthase MoaC [Candidatus Poribacteria bacterium]|nr:cyclic pyranopterin monophosphate synthase MoaC [Candidatus Poribacteria bacterium]